jgi:hypothetical protein
MSEFLHNLSSCIYTLIYLHSFLITCLLTYSMDPNPSWEASKEISHVLWNPKVHYRIHKFYLSLSWTRSIQLMPPHPQQICFVTKPVYMVRCFQHIAQPPSWRTTPYRLSATDYLIYLKLSSILEADLPFATWGSDMPWWQRHTYHGTYLYSPRHSNCVYVCIICKRLKSN